MFSYYLPRKALAAGALLFSCCLFAGCSGNSNSSSSTLPAGTICPDDAILIVSDVPVSWTRYDNNSDGCLTPAEQQNLNDAAEQLADNSKRVEGENSDNNTMKITALRLTGSYPESNNELQLDNGNFGLIIDVDNTINSSDELRLVFTDRDLLSRQANNQFNLSNGITFSNLPEGNVQIASLCRYQNALEFNCLAHIYFVDGNSTTTLADVKINDKDLNFSATGLPRPGSVIAGVCQNDDCLDNVVEVPVSFN